MIRCKTTDEAIEHFKVAGNGTQVILTGTYKNNEGVRIYFHRKGHKVGVKELPDGNRLITFNGTNETGRAAANRERQIYSESHRLDHEPTISMVMLKGERELKVGESIVVKGNHVKIKSWLRRRYPDWKTLVSKTGDAWTVIRIK